MEITEKITICLNMIVKNESKIITRLFDSLHSIIDCYCICDTGSTDNTKETITNYFKEKNIPGKIVDIPFKNFGYNRTKALQEARNTATYILLLDADMTLTIKSDFNKSSLQKDVYSIQQGNSTFKYFNTRLVLGSLDVKCVGPTHEYYSLPNGASTGQLNSIFINDIGDGGCKDNKFSRDIRLLKEGLLKEPKNGRYYFYLANSYYNSNFIDEAIEMYKKRIELGGWIEEVWYSYYRLGACYQKKGENEKAIFTWLEGYDYFPKRIENIYEIVKYYRIQSKHRLAYHFYKLGKNIPLPKDNVLFLHHDVYDFLFDYEFTIFGYYLSPRPNIFPHFRKLFNIEKSMLNSNNYNNILSNYKFYTPKICESGEKIIDISKKMDEDFVSSTPSIIIHKGKYIMNLRYVNYKIDEKGNYINKEQITTFNEYCVLDDDFSFSEREMFEEDEVITRYRGIEDVRLFSFQDKILYSGVIQNTDKKDDVEITVSINDYNKGKLVQKNLISPENRKIEKNWVLFEHAKKCKIIYEWFPLTICKIENNKLVKEICRKTPYLFHKFRGSTNGVRVGDEIWFVCHVVSYEDKRFYYHCIIRLNMDTLKIVDYSRLFTFSGSHIEYCCGLVENNGKIIFSYSIMDRTSYIMVMDKEKILNMLF